MDDYDLGFDGAGEQIAGPLIGGGVAQVGMLATRLLFPGKAVAKWSGLVGGLLGAAVGGALMFSSRYRSTGLSALVTALIIGVPRQIEEALMSAGVLKGDMDGYFGVVTPEQVSGYFGQDESGLGQDVQLLDSGGGGNLGVQVAEQVMQGAGDVEMMGGFGSNFMSH